MNIKEMTKNLQELVEDPEKAAIIFKVILKSGNQDIIQRVLELYVLLVLNHAEEITKAFDAEHDKEESMEQIIRRLERELDNKNRGYKWDHADQDKWESNFGKTSCWPIKNPDYDVEYVKEIFKNLK